MKPVATRALSRSFDERSVKEWGVSDLVLMENAGRGATDIIERDWLAGRPGKKRIVLVCGTGNNGGDGFVVARHLLLRGAAPICFIVGSREKMTASTGANLTAFLNVQGDVRDVEPGSLLDEMREHLSRADLVIDALFGTGLDRPLEGDPVGIVDMINEADLPKIALDLPSGLHADTGRVMGACVNASATVAFGHLKLGLCTAVGAAQAGKIDVADIGVPPELLGSPFSLMEDTDVRELLVTRNAAAHKFSAGHVAVIGGSEGKIGAPLMAAEAALRGGAGVVTLGTWDRVAPLLESRVREIMVGKLIGDALEGSIDALLDKKKSVTIGPGLGTDDEAEHAVRNVLRSFAGTVVVDADALRIGEANPEAFANAEGAVILTPHAGEAARILGVTSAEVDEDRLAAALSLAKRARSVVVLKGAHTIIATPSGEVRIAAKGSPALATAGSGDVLSGLIGALAATLTPFDAASVGAHVHARVGEEWEEANGDRGLLAHEIADGTPALLGRLLR